MKTKTCSISTELKKEQQREPEQVVRIHFLLGSVVCGSNAERHDGR
jgi:hypothetical protein